MTKADGNLPIRRGFPRNGLPANTARRHFFVCPDTDDDLGDAPVRCAGGGDRPLHPSLYPFCPDAARRPLPGEIAAGGGRRGVALYPSSCVVCGYKCGYNAAVMSEARWKCAALYPRERYLRVINL